MIDQQIARYAGHPYGKPSMRRMITAERTVHPEKNFLRHVLGFRGIAGKPVTQVEDTPGVPAHKFFPGRGVALEALLDQLGILLQTSSAPISRNLLRQNPQEGFSVCHRLERKLPHKCSLAADQPGR